MKRLRICLTAQRLMDKLFDDGFINQRIDNYNDDVGLGDVFSFNAYPSSQANNCWADRCYGSGTTLLKAIRQAIADSPS